MRYNWHQARAAVVFGATAWTLLSGVVQAGPAQEGSSLLENVLGWLANPNVAYLLLVIGLMALLAEISTPGASFPGVIGVIALILALIGLARLPTNWVGVLLIVAAMVMLLLDLKIAGFALSIGGLIAFLLGSFLLFTPFWVQAPTTAVRLNPWLMIATALAVEGFFILGLTRAMKAQSYPVAVGSEMLIGMQGVVVKDLDPVGVIRVEGEEWSAAAVEDIHLPAGSQVEVTALEGLLVRVASVDDDPAFGSS